MEDKLKYLSPEILIGIIQIQKEVAQAGLDLTLVMNRMVDGIQYLLKPNGTVIELVDNEFMIYQAVSGDLARGLLGMKVSKEFSLSGTATKQQQLIRCDDTDNDPRVDKETCRKLKIGSMIVAPFKTSGGTAGVLKVMSARSHSFTPETDFILTLLTDALASSLHNAEEANNRAQKSSPESLINVSLHQQKDFLNALLENLSDGVVACDAKGQLSIFNRKLREWHGLPPSNIPPEEWAQYYDLYHYDGITPLRTDEIPLFRAFAGEQVRSFGMAIAVKNQPLHFFLASGEAIYDNKKNKIGAVVVMHDVTEQKKAHNEISAFNRQLEKSVQERTEQLTEAVQARDEFLSIASHELKTPLTSLKLMAQLRMKNLEKNKAESFTLEKLKAQFHSDDKQLNRLDRLIDDMLDITRINSGKLSIHQEVFSLSEVTREVVKRFQDHSEINRNLLSVESTSEVSGFWDKFRIEQVLSNLISNALKYGENKPIKLTVSEDSQEARLVVRDHGPGIKKEDHRRIFSRFERANNDEIVAGLGLGLYIVQEIVHQHRGTVFVESEPHQGSSFIVKLPLK